MGKSDIIGTEKEVEQLSPETKTIAKEFLKLFSIKEKIKMIKVKEKIRRCHNFSTKRKKNTPSNAKTGRCGDKKITQRFTYVPFCTYRFVTVFFGRPLMPTEFQKVMDSVLAREFFREVVVFLMTFCV